MLASIVIPARSWDGHLIATLASIAAQVLPDGLTVETVVGLADEAPTACPDGVRVVHNPNGTIPDALNLAISESRGEVILRVDARCVLPPDYVTRVVDRLADPSVGSVGGAALVMDRGVFGSAYAVSFNSPLLGPSACRYRRTSGPVDTSYLGSWRAEVLRDLGGYDPRLVRNQDNELADRVRASGRTVLYDADLVVGYVNGRRFRSAVQHHHEFGMWRMYQSSQGQMGLSAKHLAALGLGLFGVAAVVAGLKNRRTRRAALAAGAAGYVAAGAVAFRTASRLRSVRGDLDLAPFHPAGVAAAPAVAAVIDAAWAAGLVRGAVAARRRSQ